MIDQTQVNDPAGAGSLDQWQSFTAGLTGDLTSIELKVGSPAYPADSPATLSVYAGEGVSGQLLTTEAITLSTCGGPSCWQSFTFTTPACVVSGSKYTYRITVPAIMVGFLDLDTNNSYAGGRSSLDPSVDLLFKTHVCGP